MVEACKDQCMAAASTGRCITIASNLNPDKYLDLHKQFVDSVADGKYQVGCPFELASHLLMDLDPLSSCLGLQQAEYHH